VLWTIEVSGVVVVVVTRSTVVVVTSTDVVVSATVVVVGAAVVVWTAVVAGATAVTIIIYASELIINKNLCACSFTAQSLYFNTLNAIITVSFKFIFVIVYIDAECS